MQRSLKLTLPNESVPWICLSCLSSSSTLSLVSLSTPTDTSSCCGGSSYSRWGAGCGMLICMDRAGICWEVGASGGRTVGDSESWATGRGTWLSNLLIIVVIRCVRFHRSFFISLNSVTDTVAYWFSWFSIRVTDLVRIGLRGRKNDLGAMVESCWTEDMSD